MRFSLKKNILIIFCFVSSLSSAHELDSLLKVLPQIKPEKSKIELWEKIINISIWQSSDSERKGYIDNLWKYSKEHNNEYGIATANLLYAKHFERLQNLEKAKMYAKQAYSSFEKQKNKLGLCKVLRQQGYNALKASNMELATELAYKALEISTSLKDRLQEALCLEQIAIISSGAQKNEAIKFQKQSLKILTEIGADREASVAIINLSTFYFNMYKDAEGLKYLDTLFLLQAKLNDVILLAQGNLQAAIAYNSLGLVHNADDAMKKSEQYYMKIDNLSKQAEFYRIKGVFYRNRGEYNNAIEVSKKGLSIIENMEGLDMEKGWLNYNLYDSYKSLKRYKEALEAYERMTEHKSNLYDEKTQIIISDLKEKYETEKKEQENKNLKQINEINRLEISKKDSKVKEQKYIVVLLTLFILILFITFLFYRKSQSLKKEKMKRKLEQQVFRTQMNPHFLFNSLNSIQRMYVEGNENDANEYVEDFATLMRRILDNSGQSTISLHEELATLEIYLNLEQLRYQNQISYSFHVDENIDVYHTQVPPLIIQPFVENAIWHGILPSHKKGHISVTLSLEKEQIKCEIHDNGVGFSPSSKANHESKGMKITEQRIGSKIMISSAPNDGTTISFYINI